MGGFKNKQVLGYDNVEELMGFIRPYTFSITKAQCLDLPPKVYTTRYVELSKNHRKQYNALRRNALEPFQLPNVLVKMLRCRQLVGGFLPDEEGQPEKRVLPAENAKLVALLEECENLPGQAIIFCNWKPEIAEIALSLPKDDILVFTGDSDADERQEMIHKFQSGKAKYFIATVQAGGIGITLTAAQTVIYYSHSDNYATRMQSEDRAHRAGTRHTVTYIDLVATDTVDETLLEAHQAKLDLATYVKLRMESNQTTGLV
jgi:SNF2 family DNA or RNA helicase